MSDHVVLLVDSRRESDGAVAICVACCGLTGPDMDDLLREDNRSWHTIYDIHKLTPAEIEAKIEEHKASKAEQHRASEVADTHVSDLVAADAPKLAELRAQMSMGLGAAMGRGMGAKGGAKLLPNKSAPLPLNSASTPK